MLENGVVRQREKGNFLLHCINLTYTSMIPPNYITRQIACLWGHLWLYSECEVLSAHSYWHLYYLLSIIVLQHLPILLKVLSLIPSPGDFKCSVACQFTCDVKPEGVMYLVFYANASK